MRKTSKLHKFNIQMGCIHRNWTQNNITNITLKLKYNFNYTFKKNIANILQCQKTYFCDHGYQHSNCSFWVWVWKQNLCSEYFATTLYRKATDGDCHVLTLSFIINLNKRLPLLLQSVDSKLVTCTANPYLYPLGSIKGGDFVD